MKQLFLIIAILISLSTCIAQQNRLGIKAGVIDVDFVGNIGYNIEFSYERAFEKLPWISIGVNIGFANFNNFPDYFEPSFFLSEDKPTTKAIDDHIKGLSLDEAFFFGFGKYNENYLQVVSNFRLFKLFSKYHFRAYSGLFIRHTDKLENSLYQFSFIGDQLDDYKLVYQLDSNIEMGWPLGIEVQTRISYGWIMSLNGMYEIPFNGRDVNQYLRLGFSKEF